MTFQMFIGINSHKSSEYNPLRALGSNIHSLAISYENLLSSNELLIKIYNSYFYSLTVSNNTLIINRDETTSSKLTEIRKVLEISTNYSKSSENCSSVLSTPTEWENIQCNDVDEQDSTVFVCRSIKSSTPAITNNVCEVSFLVFDSPYGILLLQNTIFKCRQLIENKAFLRNIR